MIQETAYIIKPEAFCNRQEIRHLINQAGLSVRYSKTLVLDRQVVNVLYPDIAGDLLEASIRFLTSGPSEVGIVQGEDAINRLLWLAGESPSPFLCNRDTIRFKFGVHDGKPIGGTIYYFNGFHRSKNSFEAQRDINLVMSLLSKNAHPKSRMGKKYS